VVNVLNDRQETPLILACSNNSLKVLREILRRGQFQPAPLSDYARKALRRESSEIKLGESETKTESSTSAELVDVDEASDISNLESALRELQRLRSLARHFISTRSTIRACDLNYKAPASGMGALQIAISKGHVDTVVELLRVGKTRFLMGEESLDFSCLVFPQGDTILHLAVKVGGKTANTLLEVSVCCVETALASWLFCFSPCIVVLAQILYDLKRRCGKSRRLAGYLLQLPLEQANADGATPLTLAIKSGSLKSLELLLALNADPNAGCLQLWDPRDASTQPPRWTNRLEDEPPEFNMNQVGRCTTVPERILVEQGMRFKFDLPPLLMAMAGPGHSAVVRRLLDAKVCSTASMHDRPLVSRLITDSFHVIGLAELR